MTAPKFAQRTDGNHAEVVKALRGIGAQAFYLRGAVPADLLVGFRGVCVVLEVKDGAKSESRRRLTAAEAEFIATFPGPVFVVTSPEEAVRRVVEAARPSQCEGKQEGR